MISYQFLFEGVVREEVDGGVRCGRLAVDVYGEVGSFPGY
jgi:hypothetical protein